MAEIWWDGQREGGRSRGRGTALFSLFSSRGRRGAAPSRVCASRWESPSTYAWRLAYAHAKATDDGRGAVAACCPCARFFCSTGARVRAPKRTLKVSMMVDTHGCAYATTAGSEASMMGVGTRGEAAVPVARENERKKKRRNCFTCTARPSRTSSPPLPIPVRPCALRSPSPLPTPCILPTRIFLPNTGCRHAVSKLVVDALIL